MPVLIRENIVVTDYFRLSDNTELAKGVKITVKPGGVLDLNSKTLLNFGTIELEGTESIQATIKNGTYSTESTSGLLRTSYSLLDRLVIDGFFSNGTLTIRDSVVTNSHIDFLSTNELSRSLIKDSEVKIGIEGGIVAETTFLNSPIEKLAWNGYSPETLEISRSNFIGEGILIKLDPFFSGTHRISINESYMKLGNSDSYANRIFDGNDTLRVQTTIPSSSFVTTPYANSENGLSLGGILLKWADLGFLPSTTGNDVITGTVASDTLSGLVGDDLIYGYAGTDNIYGGQGDDTISGGQRNDTIDGGAGLDYAIFAGSSGQYSIKLGSNTTISDTQSSRDGADSLINVERLIFAYTHIALDLGGIAGQAYRIYEAVLGRAPDLAGLGYWIKDMDSGVSLTAIAQGFIASPEFQSKYGANPSYETYINLLYNNILDRNPDPDGLNYWVSNMRNGVDTPAAVLASFSEGFENTANVAPDIANGIYYTAWIA